MKTLIVAPHPDDELLGCGGTVLRKVAHGNSVGLLIMTSADESFGWSPEKIRSRQIEVERVCHGAGIKDDCLFFAGFSAAKLDQVPLSLLVEKTSSFISDFAPSEIFVPFPGDVHSDHRATFNAVNAASKWFRNNSVNRIFAYETISETDFNIDPLVSAFHPNYFVDISDYFHQKLSLVDVYSSEIGLFPYPRSKTALISLARLRGAQAGFEYAEAFMLLKERVVK